MKCATKPYDITHLTLGMLLHYLGKLKIQISGRLSTVPVSHNFFNNLLTHICPAFLGKFVCPPLCCAPFKYKVYIKVLSLSLNTMLIDKNCSDVCCDEFSVPQIDCKSKQQNSDVENFICNQYGERLVILNTVDFKICG